MGMLKRLATYVKALIKASRKAQRIINSMKPIAKYANHILLERIENGKVKENSSKAAIIIVSHEASRTGAPILAINLCKKLAEKYNITSIVLRKGALIDDFRNKSVKVISPRMGQITGYGIKKYLKRSHNRNKPIYAIVNSIVSASTIQPLRESGIPVITLVHEFAAYIRPTSVLEQVGLWSNKIIFSSELTKNDILAKRQVLKNCSLKVLPQGKCSISENRENLKQKGIQAKDNASLFLESIAKETVVILGAGQIQPRKGVDLFISTAARIYEKLENKDIVFIWLGSGYDPENDFNVSLWLDDQIKRLDLENKLFIFNETISYDDYIKRAKIFLMTSRLDPLPNVSIDAMYNGKPMICFDKACGLSSKLKTDTYLGKALIAGYLNIEEMAERTTELIRNKALYKATSDLTRKKAAEWFNMDTYINKIDSIGHEAIEEEKILRKEIEFLKCKVNALPIISKDASMEKRERLIMEYVLRWKTDIWPKKPRAGFHPGIYRERKMSRGVKCDPYVHYLKSGEPEGEWRQELITIGKRNNIGKNTLKAALHIHVHYIELLDHIIKALCLNKCRPDIYLTYNVECHKILILKALKKYNLEPKRVIKTPNRGRDIGPLLVELGRELDSFYDVHGHIHTKKSIHINKRAANQWRELLIRNLVGSKGKPMIDKILDEFEENNQLGLIFPDDPNCVGWTNNITDALTICKIYQSRIFHITQLSCRAMFARRGALTNLYNQKWD